MPHITGELAISGGPVFRYMSAGESVCVCAFTNGSLQGSAELNSKNNSATLYNSTGIGDFTASVSIALNSGVVSLSYTVVYTGQNGNSTVAGTLAAWTSGS